MTQIELDLPLFPGFYESMLFNSDSVRECIAANKDYLYAVNRITYLDTAEFDLSNEKFKEYCHDCCVQFCNAFETFAPKCVDKVEFVKMTSPQYYNYDTDHCIANVTFKDDWKDQILEFINKNRVDLLVDINYDWSSRDGFISFISNDLKDWEEEFKKENPDPRYISGMLFYMMTYTYYDLRDRMAEDVLSNVDLLQYIERVK